MILTFDNTNFLILTFKFNILTLEAVVRRCSEKAFNFVKKETLAQVFSSECCEISKNTFFTEHLRWLLMNL